MVLNKSYNINGNYVTRDYAENISFSNVVTKIEKMSKSKLNGINIDEIIDRFGIDTLRLMIMSDFPIQQTYIWNEDLIKKKGKFLIQIELMADNMLKIYSTNILNIEKLCLEDKQSIENWSLYCNSIENYKIHNAISAIHKQYNISSSKKDINRVIIMLIMLLPITPNFAIKNIEKLIDSKLEIEIN